jgi:hypothetical protein
MSHVASSQAVVPLAVESTQLGILQGPMCYLQLARGPACTGTLAPPRDGGPTYYSWGP